MFLHKVAHTAIMFSLNTCLPKPVKEPRKFGLEEIFNKNYFIYSAFCVLCLDPLPKQLNVLHVPLISSSVIWSP
jgi:hypothetical protein